jgi:endogenous inhibitor of DNA gyrase (YacG/DUF329 family)
MSQPRRKSAVGRCPICGRARHDAFKPFCSKHCADIDLARWLDGRYAIPGRQGGEEEAESPAKQRNEDD